MQQTTASSLSLPMPQLTENGPSNHDPIRALTPPSLDAEEGDDFDIFQFFADGPSTRDSLATSASGDTQAKSVVTIAESSVQPPTSPRVLRRNSSRVEERIGDGEQTERWFSKVESML